MCTVTWLSPSTNHMHSASSIPHFIDTLNYRVAHLTCILWLGGPHHKLQIPYTVAGGCRTVDAAPIRRPSCWQTGKF